MTLKRDKVVSSLFVVMMLGILFFMAVPTMYVGSSSSVAAAQSTSTPAVVVTDLTSVLPRSYNNSEYLTALGGIAVFGNKILVVGSGQYPLVGVYNIQTGKFTDLSNQFEQEIGSGADEWTLSSVANIGPYFLIVGYRYTGSGYEPVMASYNMITNTFYNLSSRIPASYSNWILDGVTSYGGTFYIVGVEPSSTSPLGYKSVMATFNGIQFKNISSAIPSGYDNYYFIGITSLENGEFLITGWAGYMYPYSGGVLLLYSPYKGFTNLTSLVPSNVFWLSGATRHGDEVVIVGVTYPDTPALGILNLASGTYTDLTPSGTNPFPSTYYWLGDIVWVQGNAFYVVGQSQQYPPPSGCGSWAVFGKVTINNL
ncbi:hypothetical protein [Conexivisphaera calida]|nr:hypothetical protein [Conexivisphaera calida]